MGAFGFNAYRAFVLLLGIWTGSGLHDSLTNHFAWHADPVGFAARPIPEGTFNPWPFSTMLLLVATIAAGVALWRYRGAGRRGGVITVAGTALIIAATLGWFVPQLILMDGGTLTDAELIGHARTWIMLNAVRQVLLVGFFAYALVVLPLLAGDRLGDSD